MSERKRKAPRFREEIIKTSVQNLTEDVKATDAINISALSKIILYLGWTIEQIYNYFRGGGNSRFLKFEYSKQIEFLELDREDNEEYISIRRMSKTVLHEYYNVANAIVAEYFNQKREEIINRFFADLAKFRDMDDTLPTIVDKQRHKKEYLTLVKDVIKILGDKEYRDRVLALKKEEIEVKKNSGDSEFDKVAGLVKDLAMIGGNSAPEDVGKNFKTEAQIAEEEGFI